MDPNLNNFRILGYVLNHMDPRICPPLPSELQQTLLTQFPYLNYPQVLVSLTQVVYQLNIIQTLSLLKALGPRPEPSAVSVAKAKIAEIQSKVDRNLEGIEPHVTEEFNKTAEREMQIYEALVRLDAMHEEYVKQLRVAEQRLVEAYGTVVAESVKGSDEELNEEVVEILRKGETEEVRRVELSGRELRFLPEAFGKLLGLVALDLSRNQLEVRMNGLLSSLSFYFIKLFV